LNIQILFSLKLLLKQRSIFVAMLVLLIAVPLILVSLNGSGLSLREAWYTILHLQMIVAVLIVPIILHSIWKGKIQLFEKQLILYHIHKPFEYYMAKLFAVCFVISSILVLFYTVFWLLLFDQISITLWYSTIVQIILTLAFAVALAGLLSLLLKRTIYGTILMILYLIISIQFIRSSMFALWFNPDFIEQMMLEPSFLIQRFALLCWIIILLLTSKALFVRQVVSS